MSNNIQVSHSTSPKNARSESCVVVNPQNHNQVVGASKKFTDPQTYAFSLITYYSSDNGNTWKEAAALPLIRDWVGYTDPALAWDNENNVFLVALGFGPNVNTPPDYDLRGIVIFKSTDGGKTWSAPKLIHDSTNDDKQWAVGDNSAESPHYGNVYASWDLNAGGDGIAFARTTDHGASWDGGVQAENDGQLILPSGRQIPGTLGMYYSEINVARDGTIFIVAMDGSNVMMVKSSDGGCTFSAPITVAAGVSTLSNGLPNDDGFPHFPGLTFRALTFPTACSGSTNEIVVAWPDMRDGVSNIYYRRSVDGGNTWLGNASGQRLLAQRIGPVYHSFYGFHHFNPQLACQPDGVIGCAFYEVGPKDTIFEGPYLAYLNLIDVCMSYSMDQGASFKPMEIITDQPWNPVTDAPFSHGNPNLTFIGDYFGIDASAGGFFPFWTDTRTGIQEIFVKPNTNWVNPLISINHSNLGDTLNSILGGEVKVDGNNIILLNPDLNDPNVTDMLAALSSYKKAAKMDGNAGTEKRKLALNSIMKVVSQKM